ncbi:protein Diedel-like [Drosophila eugracilis]|uniref:protein Diedel-like n=1 Tax=Drosophila eugracilis TaxID=29029 RepID=UPI001BDB52CD|nr:protein Diedel-like [Drosophila eugracilis]
MKSSAVTLLLIGICFLALVNKSNAVCCVTKEELTYKMSKGECKDVGGYGNNPQRCTVLICADGMAQVGMFCGRSSCNLFGCSCDGGCLEGNWSQSFVYKHSYYGIEIINVKRYL